MKFNVSSSVEEFEEKNFDELVQEFIDSRIEEWQEFVNSRYDEEQAMWENFCEEQMDEMRMEERENDKPQG